MGSRGPTGEAVRGLFQHISVFFGRYELQSVIVGAYRMAAYDR